MNDADTMQLVSDRTADLLGLADVERWGVIKTLRPQSVAEHSFAVAVIAMELAERLGHGKVDYTDGMHLLWWSLVHDAPETLTSDIDGKFKRDNPEFRAALVEAEEAAFPWYKITARHVIPAHVRWTVKAADKIESISFIQMWGKGPRANDIFHELTAILFNEIVPNLANAVGEEADAVSYHVRDLLYQSTSESNSIQLRRHRRPK